MLIPKSDAEKTLALEEERINREVKEVSTQEEILEVLTTISEQLSELIEFLRNTR